MCKILILYLFYMYMHIYNICACVCVCVCAYILYLFFIRRHTRSFDILSTKDSAFEIGRWRKQQHQKPLHLTAVYWQTSFMRESLKPQHLFHPTRSHINFLIDFQLQQVLSGAPCSSNIEEGKCLPPHIAVNIHKLGV